MPELLSRPTTFSDKTFRNASISSGELVRIFLQVCLAFMVAKVFAVEEGRGFLDVILLVAGAFVIHAKLPLRFRLPFFLACSIGAIVAVLGPTSALWIVGIGLGLIGACHLPIPFWTRVGIVLMVAITLVAIQAGWFAVSRKITNVIPVLGGIFMFRLALYLYELRHESGFISPWQRLSYFFLLPNPLFPLFPVVDYKTFLRTYYNEPAARVYQKGVSWIVRGIIHLILYRLVYNFMTPDADQVTGFGGVVMFAVSSYLLYLRISGQFHLIIGVLSLFGFNLPETHRFYLLASGFNDYWRRINIYWKDFMMKLVYYPVFMRARKLGMLGGLCIATVAVFVGTWFLHAYQWFWLRGEFPITMVDALFWGIFGVLVIINSLFEATRKPSQKGRRDQAWDLARAFRKSCQIGAMFVLMCLLWSLWSSPTIAAWWGVISRAGFVTASEFMWTASVVVGGICLGLLAQRLRFADGEYLSNIRRMLSCEFLTVAPLLVLLVVGTFHYYRGFEGKAGDVADAMRGLTVRAQDQMALERGYYEGLLSGSSSYAQLLRDRRSSFSVREKVVAPDDLPQTKVHWLKTKDIRAKTYLPLAQGVTVGRPWSINRWGMRDRDYSKDKPPGVYRIALLGASYTMGRGVGDGNNFESVLEEILNEKCDLPIEILNFAMSNYSTLENLYVCDRIIPEFQPDAMIFVAHGVEQERCSRKLAKHTVNHVDLTYDYLKTLQRRGRFDPAVSEAENLRRIGPFAEGILDWCYKQMAESCKRRGIVPVWMFLPTTQRVHRADKDAGTLRPIAERAGFNTMIVYDPYGGMTLDEVRLHEIDSHPNENAHKVMGNQIYEALKKEAPQLGLEIQIRN